MDLTSGDGTDLVKKLILDTDVLIEGSRPGFMEHIGLRPDIFLIKNPSLVYTSMTEWGQTETVSRGAELFP